MAETNLLNSYKNTLFNKIKHAFDTQDFDRVIKLSPEYMKQDKNNPWVHAYFGYALTYMGNADDFELAKQYIDHALKLKPDEAEFYILLGKMCRDGKLILKSIPRFIQAIELSQSPSAYYNLGVAYVSLGEIEKGLDLIFYAIQKEPNLKYIEDLNQLIYYDPRFKNEDYIKFGKLFYYNAKDKLKIEPFKHKVERYDSKKAKLRIGFFCAEALTTPTWHFLEKIFMRMDRTRFDIYCYSRPPQQLTKVETHDVSRIRNSADIWRYCHFLSIKETAKLIHDDQLDMLIDLSGYLPSFYGYYSNEPNICIFMYKPAPVQINWYGFWGTTGIPEIDYLITTADNVPQSQNHNFTEKIYRLKNGYTHSEIFTDIPDHAEEPPCIKNGYITFASFSRATKLNSQVYNIWSEILKRVENSKLLIKYTMNAEEYMKNMIYSNFEQRGISRDRILIDTNTEKRAKFLSAYDSVDVALEPIPFGGVTTTINALTMGVPVIAKYEEDRVVNGGTCSLLKVIGCKELAASSAEEYIENAVRTATNIEKLKEYRTVLRNRTLNSSINAEQYTKDLVEAFEFIWQDSCKKVNQSVDL